MSLSVCAAVLLSAGCLTGWTQEYTISTVAGGIPAPTPANAIKASLGRPLGLTVGPSGDLFVSADHAVFRVDQADVLTRVAGTGIAGYSGDGGPAIQAQLNDPRGLAFDPSGNLYIAEWRNQVVRKVAPGGTISTVVGIPCPYAEVDEGCGYGLGGDHVPATSVRISGPHGVATDSAGNLYLTDGGLLRKVDLAGTITTIASDQNSFAADGFFYGVAVDDTGNVYAETDVYLANNFHSFVLKVALDGTVTTTAIQSTIDNVAVDLAGNLYVSANLCCVFTLNPDGTLSTVAGSGEGYSGDGGPAVKALIDRPEGMAFDRSGNLYIADSNNMRVRKVTSDGIIETFAGNGTNGYSGDGGPAVSAQVSAESVALDAQGNLYFTDSFDAVVRVLKADRTIATVAGIPGQHGYSGDGGPAVNARLSTPLAVAIDAIGNLYLTDSYRVRKVTPAGTISTIAGTGTSGHSGDGGPAIAAQIEPGQIAVDAVGNLYFAELYGFIRKVSHDGTITTVAGGGRALPGDGGRATDAQLLTPGGIAIDGSGNLFFGDRGLPPEFRFGIRKVTPDGIISRVAGYDRQQPGIPTSNSPDVFAASLASDRAGNLYITDGCVVHKLATDGAMVPVAGSVCGTYSGEGGPASQAHLLAPDGIAVDPAGNVFFADGPDPEAFGPGSGAIRLLRPPETPLLSVGATLLRDAGRPVRQTLTLLVNNGAPRFSTAGVVTVTEMPPSGTVLISMAGPGWTCAGNTCTRGDTLRPGETYPPIAAVVSGTPAATTNLALVSGGGSPDFTSSDYVDDSTLSHGHPPERR